MASSLKDEEDENALKLGVEIGDPDHLLSPVRPSETDQAVPEVEEASSSEHPSPISSAHEKEM